MTISEAGKVALPFLYDENDQFIEEVWGEKEISVMFYTLSHSKDYLKTIWGEWMKARDLCILAALRYELLRPGEACGIMFKDLHLDKGYLYVRGELNKEKKSRIMVLHSKFLEYYNFYTSFPSWMWKGSPYLFPSAENQHISSQRWKMIFREKVLKPSGLYKPVASHKMPQTRSYLLRISGATTMLDDGCDPWTVAQTLGHADLTTLKEYWRLTERFKNNQKQFLELIK